MIQKTGPSSVVSITMPQPTTFIKFPSSAYSRENLRKLADLGKLVQSVLLC